ncbi:hypothetical protein ABTN76_20125, partial [Acinetobacter baumannii]
ESARRPSCTSAAAASPDAATSVAVTEIDDSATSADCSAVSAASRVSEARKGSLLELVDGLLDAIDQLANEWPGIEARDLSARLNRNPV